MVKEKAIERGVVSLVQETTLKMQENADIGDVLFGIGEKTSELQESLVGADQSKHISIAVTESVEELNKRIEAHEKGLMQGIPTGLVDVNRHTCGWQKQDLIILAARPGMGKTSLALLFAKSAAKSGFPVALFSLEMGRRQLTDKMIIGESGIKSDAYKAGIIQPEQVAILDASTSLISSLPIYIDDKPGVSISYVRSRCRLLHKQKKCEMVIIDYLQLMSGQREQGGNREQEISSISRGCKAIAKELDVPVIILSQLNRKCEDRADKRPMLQDLRESGAIEQDADIVCFIHRPEEYKLPCKDRNGNEIANGIELIFAKFRNGSTGVLYAQHNDSLTQFYDINTGQYKEANFTAPRPYHEPEKQDDLPF
jgi:replicative DNA helicase